MTPPTIGILFLLSVLLVVVLAFAVGRANRRTAQRQRELWSRDREDGDGRS
jgi:hypothetical protein